MDEWKVLFEENYWGSYCADTYEGSVPAREARDEEIGEMMSADSACEQREAAVCTAEHRIHEIVEWYGETWELLSFYTCSEGLVLDYCKKIDPRELQSFTSRFQEANLEGDCFNEELFERLQLDNPTSPNVEVGLNRGDVELSWEGVSCVTYVPDCAEEQENDPVALLCMEHYGLNMEYAWHFCRAHYLWDEGHPEDLSGLTAVFDEREVTVPGKHFHLTGNAQKISLVHPANGQQFDLCIEQIEAQELDRETLMRLDENGSMVYPTHFETISYYTDPEIPGDSYMLKALMQGDSPIAKDTSEKAVASVSVIGGSSGPVSIFLAGKGQADTVKMRSICSPLFFKPTQVRDWYISYLIKRREPLSQIQFNNLITS